MNWPASAFHCALVLASLARNALAGAKQRVAFAIKDSASVHEADVRGGAEAYKLLVQTCKLPEHATEEELNQH